MTTAAPESVFTFDEETHVYRLDGVPIPSVTQAIAEAGMSDWVKHVDPDVLQYTSERGKAMHRAIHLLNADELDPESVDPVVAPRIETYQRFLLECDFTPLYSEKPGYHAQLKYAGTPDVVGWMRNDLCVVDYKSGCVPAGVALQLAGYCGLLEGGPFRRYSLALTDKGTYRLREYPLAEFAFDRRMFECCLAITQYKRTKGARR